MILEENMDKLYVCYMMNNLIDDINDVKNDMNLIVSENLKKRG